MSESDRRTPFSSENDATDATTVQCTVYSAYIVVASLALISHGIRLPHATRGR